MEQKPESVKIVHIAAAAFQASSTVFGLGDDQRVYRWRSDTKTWEC